MFLDSHLADEPRFAGSRFAPAGCQEFTTPGANVFTWPAGVDRAVVFCKGAGGGASNSTHTRGGAAGGGGAAAERLVLMTDATATVNVPTGGVANTDGGDASFIQASSGTEYCAAKGGKKGVGPAGGAGGLASASYGSIKYDGGDGGVSGGFGDGGGGGGASASGLGDGGDGHNDGADFPPDEGGHGGALFGGSSEAGGRGGEDGAAGGSASDGGAGGPGTDGANTGVGSNGYVSVCWEDPEPTGYCIDDRCVTWWGFNCCSYYRYGRRCFYYGYYHGYGYGPYLYGDPNGPGWPVHCCADRVFPATLKLSIVGAINTVGTQTVDMVAVALPSDPSNFYYRAALIDPAGMYLWVVISPALASFCILLFCSTTPNDPGTIIGNWSIASCDPVFLVFQLRVPTPGVCAGMGPAAASSVELMVTE